MESGHLETPSGTRSGPRLTISTKMILGYLPLALLTVAISALALWNLDQLNQNNRSVVGGDIPLSQTTDAMVDSVIELERYGSRYLILGDQTMRNVFERRRLDLLEQHETIAGLTAQGVVSPAQIQALRHSIDALLTTWAVRLRAPSSGAENQLAEEHEHEQRALLALLEELHRQGAEGRDEKSEAAAQIGQRAFRITVILCGLGLLIGLGAALLITRDISRSVRRLKLATQRVGEGHYTCAVEHYSNDELGDLAGSFADMEQRLQQLETLHLDASPLTHLPGGVAIESVLQEWLDTGTHLAFCLIDLDYFKAFNDRYGYARGNEVLKWMGRLVQETVEKHGKQEDFAGHIGGDDFVVLTCPGHFRVICEEIVRRFDEQIPKFYDTEDLQRGFTEGINRQGKPQKFPVMTVSIGVVTNQKRQLRHYVEVGEIAAELKEHAKAQDGSLFVVDQRGPQESTPIEPAAPRLEVV